MELNMISMSESLEGRKQPESLSSWARDLVVRSTEEACRKEAERLEQEAQVFLDLGFIKENLRVEKDGNGLGKVVLIDGLAVPPESISKGIERLKATIDKCNKQISIYRSLCRHKLCRHKYDVTDTWNDHDGWSVVEINYFESVKCGICGKCETRKTGTSRH